MLIKNLTAWTLLIIVFWLMNFNLYSCLLVGPATLIILALPFLTAIQTIILETNNNIESLKVLIINGILAVLFSIWFSVFSSARNVQAVSGIDSIVIAIIALVGGLLAIDTTNLLFFFVALELFSLAKVSIVATDIKKIRGAESAIKYLVLGSCATVFFLLAVWIYFSAFNSLNLNLIVSEKAAGLFGLGLGIIIFFKMGLAPFHIWVPDVITAAAPIYAAYFSSVLKFVTGALAIIFMPIVINQNLAFDSTIGLIISIAVIFSLGLSSILGLSQTSIARLLAYSSIGQVGWFFSSFLCNSSFLVPLNYIAIYSCTALGLWLVILVVGAKKIDLTMIKKNSSLAESQSDLHTAQLTTELVGLAQKKPALAGAIIILLFSSAGLPPFAGFFIKLTILFELVMTLNYTVAIIACAASIVSSFFYLSLIIHTSNMTTRGGLQKTYIDLAIGSPRIACQFAISIAILLAIQVIYLILGFSL